MTHKSNYISTNYLLLYIISTILRNRILFLDNCGYSFAHNFLPIRCSINKRESPPFLHSHRRILQMQQNGLFYLYFTYLCQKYVIIRLVFIDFSLRNHEATRSCGIFQGDFLVCNCLLEQNEGRNKEDNLGNIFPESEEDMLLADKIIELRKKNAPITGIYWGLATVIYLA